MKTRKTNYIEHFLILICWIYFLSGCEVNNKKESYEKDLAAIKYFLRSSGDAANTGNVEAEVNRFTEDGIYLWPDAPSIVGHEELRNWFGKRFAKVYVRLENVTEEIELCGDWAFERGIYVAQIQPKERDETETVYGKYINFLRKQPDGSWKIARRIRNRDHPVSQP
jgi:ketosteroid isomerase-like protein